MLSVFAVFLRCESRDAAENTDKTGCITKSAKSGSFADGISIRRILHSVSDPHLAGIVYDTDSKYFPELLRPCRFLTDAGSANWSMVFLNNADVCKSRLQKSSALLFAS